MFSFSLQFLVSLNSNINHSVPQVHQNTLWGIFSWYKLFYIGWYMYPSHEWIVFTLWEIFKTLLVVKRRKFSGGSCEFTSRLFTSPYIDILTGFLVFFKTFFKCREVGWFRSVYRIVIWNCNILNSSLFPRLQKYFSTSRKCLLYYRVLCTCCTIEYDVLAALSSTMYLLHYRVPCVCCTIEYGVPFALSSTMYLLHYRVRCTCCTID
jgi:hypothetical protein